MRENVIASTLYGYVQRRWPFVNINMRLNVHIKFFFFSMSSHISRCTFSSNFHKTNIDASIAISIKAWINTFFGMKINKIFHISYFIFQIEIVAHKISGFKMISQNIDRRISVEFIYRKQSMRLKSFDSFRPHYETA